ERILSPAQKDVPLLIALELELRVDEKRCLRPVLINLHRVVDDEVDRLQRVDPLWAAAERFDGVAHRGEIDDGWNASEVLKQHTARAKRDLFFLVAGHVPRCERLDITAFHERVVFVPEQILEEDLEAEWERRDPAIGELSERGQPIDGV